MTITDDQIARGQRILEVALAHQRADELTKALLADAEAELTEADELRGRVAELEERVRDLVEELGEERATAEEFALQRRADEAEIARLQSRLRDAETAMAGMVAELGERRAS